MRLAFLAVAVVIGVSGCLENKTTPVFRPNVQRLPGAKTTPDTGGPYPPCHRAASRPARTSPRRPVREPSRRSPPATA